MKKKVVRMTSLKQVLQKLEQLERQVSLKVPEEFHRYVGKTGYYTVVQAPSNGTDSASNPLIQIQWLNDRMRLSLEVQGGYRVIQYDFYYE